MRLKGQTQWEDLTSIQQSYLLAYHQTRGYDDNEQSALMLKSMFGGK